MLDGLLGSIGKKYQSGTLLGSGGLLGGLLGEEARKDAQRKAIMQLGASLIGQGPTTTPQRLGPAIAQGLLGAQQQFKSGLSSQLGDVTSLLALKKTTQPKYEKIKLADGSEAFMDVNPSSLTKGQTLSPSSLLSATSDAGTSSDASGEISDELIKEVPTIELAATGEIGDVVQKGVRGLLGRLGFEVGEKQAEAISYVNNLNSDTKIALTKAFGGRLTGPVKDELNKVLPDPNETNVEFRAKTKSFINFANIRLSELKDLLSKTKKLDERTELENKISEFENQVDRYKAMLKKSEDYQTGEGLFAPRPVDLQNPFSNVETDALKQMFPSQPE